MPPAIRANSLPTLRIDVGMHLPLTWIWHGGADLRGGYRGHNVGVNGNVPEVDALTVRRIEDAYNHAHRRVRVMMSAFGAWAFADWFTGLNPNRTARAHDG